MKEEKIMYENCFLEGKKARNRGFPPTACPYTNGLKHEAWKKGWINDE